jgi:hypothetical protein
MRILCLLLVLLLSPEMALAKPGKGKKARHGRKDAKVVVFSDGEREHVMGYFLEAHGRGNCPPGLAKKNNGCLPPGQAKKRYVIGRRLPGGVIVTPLPPVLLRRLGPPPRGYTYGIVDGDVLKLAVGTMLVVDVIDALID